MAAGIDLEEADQLYTLPLDEFTPARNALAKRLRAEGRREEADAVTGMRKPTVAAWGLNQLARSRDEHVGRLVEAATRVQQATSGTELRDTSRALRAAVTDATEAAAQILEDAGRSAGAQRERIASTLQAVTADPDAAELFRQGRLIEDLVPAGFGPAVSVPATPGVDPALPEAQAAVEDVTRRLAAAEEAAADAGRRADDAQAAAELATAQAEKEADAASAAAEAVESLEEELEQARARLDSLGD